VRRYKGSRGRGSAVGSTTIPVGSEGFLLEGKGRGSDTTLKGRQSKNHGNLDEEGSIKPGGPADWVRSNWKSSIRDDSKKLLAAYMKKNRAGGQGNTGSNRTGSKIAAEEFRGEPKRRDVYMGHFRCGPARATGREGRKESTAAKRRRQR